MSKKEKIVENLALPKDMALGAVLVNMIGDSEVCIANFKSIVHFSDTCVKLQTKHKRLVICGKDLQIPYYSYDEMKITGLIESIGYE